MQLLGVRVYWTIEVAMAGGSVASARDEEERPELVLTFKTAVEFISTPYQVFPANQLVATCL